MNIVFDFAGVLFGWSPPALVQRILPRRASDPAAALRLVDAVFQGFGGDWGDFDRGTVQTSVLATRIAARTGLTEAEVRAVVDAVAAELQPMQESVALVEALHGAGRRLFFLSNIPVPCAEQLDRSHGFLRCFSDGVYSGRVGLVKPEPAIFELAAQRFDRAPAELLFFDDVPANVDAARAAGWQARVFVDAAGCRRDLEASGLLPAAAAVEAAAR